MSNIKLEFGETVTYRTRMGGNVVVRTDEADALNVRCFRADCEACGTHGRADRTSLPKTREWAQEHAAQCTTLPKDYVDVQAEATEHASTAARLLKELKHRSSDPSLLERIHAHTRLADIYTDLARNQR